MKFHLTTRRIACRSKRHEEWRMANPSPGGIVRWGIPRQIHIGEFRIGCIFVKVYIYIIFGVWKIFESCFEGILNADWIWKLIFFLGRLYQRILNWKFWRIVNLKGSSFWIFIKLPSIFQGRNVSWNFWIEVCRTVLKVIPRIARDWNCSEEYFRSYYPILCIEKFLDRYLVNNFFFDIVS